MLSIAFSMNRERAAQCDEPFSLGAMRYLSRILTIFSAASAGDSVDGSVPLAMTCGCSSSTGVASWALIESPEAYCGIPSELEVISPELRGVEVLHKIIGSAAAWTKDMVMSPTISK